MVRETASGFVAEKVSLRTLVVTVESHPKKSRGCYFIALLCRPTPHPQGLSGRRALLQVFPFTVFPFMQCESPIWAEKG